MKVSIKEIIIEIICKDEILKRRIIKWRIIQAQLNGLMRKKDMVL